MSAPPDRRKHAPTVASEWGMRCPNCLSDSHLDIALTVFARLCVDGTDIDNQDHEWSPRSFCRCYACAASGRVSDFTLPHRARRSLRRSLRPRVLRGAS